MFNNQGSSGTGYRNSYDGAAPFYEKVAQFAEVDETCVVTFFGSFNDIWDSPTIGEITDTDITTVCGCINKTFDNLCISSPKTKFGVITPTPWQQYTPMGDNSLAIEYVDKLIAICKRRGIPYLDLFRCSGLRPWEGQFRENFYTHDDGNGTHPDEKGHEIISHPIYSFIKFLIG